MNFSGIFNRIITVPKFKVGDMVQIKSSGLLFTLASEEYCGKQFRIVGVRRDEDNSDLIEYDLDTPKPYTYCETMFIGLRWDASKRKYVPNEEYIELRDKIEKTESELAKLRSKMNGI